MKSLALIIALLGLSWTVPAQSRELQATDLIGSYTHSGGFAGSTIRIEPEGKFEIDSSDCTQEHFEAGTYTFKNGVLYFVTTKLTVKSHGETDEQARNLLDPKTYEEEYHQKPPAGDRTDEFVPLTWGDRIYLIRKADLSEFPNAINLGVEPRKSRGTDWYLGGFYLRNGDEDKAVSGRPSLPKHLIELLLDKPIEARVINIEFAGDNHLAVVDKGTDAGLKEGMRLVFVGRDTFWDGPSLWSGLLVVSVTRDMAKLKPFEEVKIGDTVSTKFIDRRFKEGER